MLRLLFRLFGPYPALIFGDALVLDRWLWLRRNLPPRDGAAALLDVGCGAGTFSNAATKRGYQSTGVSFNAAQNEKARLRAAWTSAPARYLDHDIRQLDDLHELHESADVVICTETIEHILNDHKLMTDIAACLKPGGRLLMTAPYKHYKAITPEDDGPFSTVEDGRHVRRGYTEESYRALTDAAGLEILKVGFCSGFLSQFLTKTLRKMSAFHYVVGWLVILPFRVLPPVLDPIISLTTKWPAYSMTLIATKPNK